MNATKPSCVPLPLLRPHPQSRPVASKEIDTRISFLLKASAASDFKEYSRPSPEKTSVAPEPARPSIPDQKPESVNPVSSGPKSGPRPIPFFYYRSRFPSLLPSFGMGFPQAQSQQGFSGGQFRLPPYAAPAGMYPGGFPPKSPYGGIPGERVASEEYSRKQFVVSCAKDGNNNEEAKGMCRVDGNNDGSGDSSDIFSIEKETNQEREEGLSVNAYRRRNVYKSIVRHMYSYVRKNRKDVVRVLELNGFSMSDIEHAFFKISHLNDLERQKGTSKKSQSTIKKMLQRKSIYTYILRETLFAMMQNWKLGKTGKISQENLIIYKEVCEKYYQKTVELLAQTAQGTSYQL